MDCRSVDLKMSSATLAKEGTFTVVRVWHKSTHRRTPQNQSKTSNQQQQQYKTTHQVKAEEDESDSSDCYQLFTLQAGTQTKPLTVTAKANNCDLEMEADTGASFLRISEATYQFLWEA